LLYAGRPGAAAPATGIFQLHVEQQRDLVEAALRGATTETTHRDTHRLTIQPVRKSS
jgi:2-oxoglutarate dehydrogenase E1 component